MARKNQLPVAPIFVEIGQHKLTVEFGTTKPRLYALVIGNRLCLNMDYEIKISGREANREHRFGCILHAVAHRDFPKDTVQALLRAAEYRKFHDNLKDQIADILDLNS